MPATRIVILDDEENIGRSLKLILERENYSVTVCRTAAEFQARADARRGDAYLIDVRLPDGNGIGILRSMRQLGITAPAVMISGH